MEVRVKLPLWLTFGRGLLLALMVASSLSCCRPRPPSEPLVLNDFESEADLDRIAWRCRVNFTLAGAYRSHGQSGVLMTLYPDAYPGLRILLPPGMRDWRDYHSLALDVVNPENKPLVLWYRLDDTKDLGAVDRVTGTFKLRPGNNRLRLDLARLRTSRSARVPEWKHIRSVWFYLVSPPRPVSLGVDYIRLEPSAADH